MRCLKGHFLQKDRALRRHQLPDWLPAILYLYSPGRPLPYIAHHAPGREGQVPENLQNGQLLPRWVRRKLRSSSAKVITY